MIWFEELQTRKKISKIFNAYEKTFPEDERRNKEQFLDLAENPDVFVLSAKDEDETIGYVVVWEIGDFYFLEHFEVYENFRYRKYGEMILSALQEKFVAIVLETEPEFLSDLAKRRLHFYERNGFDIIDRNYLQPSYGEGKSELNLYLMSNFQPKNLDEVITNIHESVYQKMAD